MIDFEKLDSSKIPPDDYRKISSEVIDRVTKIWSNNEIKLSLTCCSRCSYKYGLSRCMKTRCVSNIETMESLCSNCFAEKLEKELIKKYLDEHKPKLNLTDFARV